MRYNIVIARGNYNRVKTFGKDGSLTKTKTWINYGEVGRFQLETEIDDQLVVAFASQFAREGYSVSVDPQGLVRLRRRNGDPWNAYHSYRSFDGEIFYKVTFYADGKTYTEPYF